MLAITAGPAALAQSPGEPGQLPPADARTQPPDHHAELAEHFPGPLRAYVSQHFVVLHDAAPEQAKVRVALLETTRRAFHASFERLGLELKPPDRRLVALLFTDRDSYGRYARQVDGTDMTWTTGYYSGRTNRTVLVDERLALPPDPEAPAADPDLARHAEQAEQIVLGSLDPSAFDGPWRGLASTTHEAAHQLAYNTGVQKRGVMYPLWVSEGLATTFETENPSQPFGPGQINVRRQRDLFLALDEDRLLPLHRFVVGVRIHTDRPRLASALYAQAWSLFHFLYLERPEQLAGYLATAAELRPGRRPEPQRRQEFIDAFGPLEEVERDWLAHVQAQRDAADDVK
ncbi:MAG: DUF1570 domain-containing protein [Phycisphaeraceae bacterium]